MTALLVGLGGLCGVLARYGIGKATLHTDALLWSTVGINIVGSFLLGLLAAEDWFSRDVREALGSASWAGLRPSRPSPFRSCWTWTPGSRGGPSAT